MALIWRKSILEENQHSSALADWLNRQASADRYWIGYSGGRDSHVLLHLCARLHQHGRFRFAALHVHHGLQANADACVEHCAAVCAELAMPFEWRRVQAKPQPGESPEEAARNARYAAFAEVLAANEALLTAQHADDQAETLLLQLLRGAGLPGLAAMPESLPLGRGRLLRPLLGWSRDDFQAYLQNYRLSWMEDPSNKDTAFDRNFIRQHILPLLTERWPSAASTLARSARHCAEAQRQLDRLADDLLLAATDAPTQEPAGSAIPPSFPLGEGRGEAHQNTVYSPHPSPLPRGRGDGGIFGKSDLCRYPRPMGEGGGRASNTLNAALLRQWQAPEQRLVLRHWLKNSGFRAPSTAVLQRIIAEVLVAGSDRNPQVIWREGEVRRYRDRLYALQPLAAFDSQAVYAWDGRQPLRLPGNGILSTRNAVGQGIRAEYLQRRWEVRYRQGGERCRLANRAGSHALKKLFQETEQLPPWVRQRIPLLYIDAELAAVGDLWVCQPFAGGDIQLCWTDHGLYGA